MANLVVAGVIGSHTELHDVDVGLAQLAPLGPLKIQLAGYTHEIRLIQDFYETSERNNIITIIDFCIQVNV